MTGAQLGLSILHLKTCHIFAVVDESFLVAGMTGKKSFHHQVDLPIEMPKHNMCIPVTIFHVNIIL